MGLLMTSCVGDTADNSSSRATTKQEANQQKTNPNVSANQGQANITNAAPSRSTENIKVNMPNSSAAPNAATNPQAATNAKSPTEIQSGKKTNRLTGKQKALEQNKEKIDKSIKAHGGKTLPSACNLVNASFISQVMGNVEFSDIITKDGSGKKAVDARSCFFKWDDQGNPNGGVLLQIQRNPLPDEFPDWASYYISSKRNQGDQMPDGSGSYRYKDFPGMGIAGGYNYDLGRYVWRTETDNVFMVAFNLQSSEAEQLIWAEKIGKEAMRNFKNYTN